MKQNNILINMDCLLDTMLGSVAVIDKRLIPPLMLNNYLGRLHNNLHDLNGDINPDKLKEVYLNRDVNTLKLSGRSFLFDILAPLLYQNSLVDSDHPAYTDYKIVINTYPYKLTNSQKKEFFLCFRYLLKFENIKQVYIPFESLTFDYLKNYNRVFLYDFNEWIGMVLNELKTSLYPDLIITTPFCSIESDVNIEDLDTAVEINRIAYSSHFKLDHLLLKEMSMFIPVEAIKNKVNGVV